MGIMVYSLLWVMQDFRSSTVVSVREPVTLREPLHLPLAVAGSCMTASASHVQCSASGVSSWQSSCPSLLNTRGLQAKLTCFTFCLCQGLVWRLLHTVFCFGDASGIYPGVPLFGGVSGFRRAVVSSE